MPAPFYTLPFRNGRSAVTAQESALGQLLAAKPVSQTFSMSGLRGCRVQVYGTAADGDTATVTVYALDQVGSGENGSTGNANRGYFCISLGSFTLVQSAAVGTADTYIPANNRFVDTMVWTPSTYGTARLTYCGGNIAAFSPADNTIAELLISDIGGSTDLAFVFTSLSVTGSTNFVPLISAIV